MLTNVTYLFKKRSILVSIQYYYERRGICSEHSDSKFHKLMEFCKSAPSCNFDDSLTASMSFSIMNQSERINVVRGMLLAVTSEFEMQNELSVFAYSWRKRKGNESAGEETNRSNINILSKRGDYVQKFSLTLHSSVKLRFASTLMMCLDHRKLLNTR